MSAEPDNAGMWLSFTEVNDQCREPYQMTAAGCYGTNHKISAIAAIATAQ